MAKRIFHNLGKKDNGTGTSNNKKPIFVYPGKVIIAIALNDPKKSTYSYSVEVEPLYGSYYDNKNKKWHYADNLKNYHVILNISENDAKDIRKGDIIFRGIKLERFIELEGDDDGETS